MGKNLVIVESPAKAKTIEKFLGKDFVVKSSNGHIRDLSKKDYGIKIDDNYAPVYEVSPEKKKVVKDLKSEVKKAEMVWLASDEDREGEAIAWHLFETLSLKNDNTKRIVFHEITKNAILHAVENPRGIDYNLVSAQQARRVLDRMVGFELSPVLWKKVKPALSAGRVQSVTVRLIVEREREINAFTPESAFKITALFTFTDKNGKVVKLAADYQNKLKSEENVKKFFENCKNAEYKVADVQKKPFKRSPTAPFTTSTLQQEASRKLGFSVSQTMSVAQKLYESGQITYMRTDSVNLSESAIKAAKEHIVSTYGEKYLKTRRYKSKAKGAQEAHEAIRPTYIDKADATGTYQERRLYQLIRKRTIASQMADAQLERTNISIDCSTCEKNFVASGEQIKFDGFLKVYFESVDDETKIGESKILPEIPKGSVMNLGKIDAIQRFTKHPARYTEASLVKKLEELGIGRPSTYAPTISTVQKRAYVVKEDRDGKERSFLHYVLENKEITRLEKKEKVGSEKAKLFPTDIGIVVNDFLVKHFEDILDYNFTAEVEQKFDQIAVGDLQWSSMIDTFYKPFHKKVDETLEISGRDSGEKILGNDPETGKIVLARIGRFGPIVQLGRPDEDDKPIFASLAPGQLIETITLDEALYLLHNNQEGNKLGIDPASGKPVFARVGRYGPMVQIGSSSDEEKPRFASLMPGQDITKIDLQAALKLFEFPRNLGEFEGKTVAIGVGRFGPYVRHNSKFTSLKKTDNPLSITLERAVELIVAKREADAKKLIKKFDEEPDILVVEDRWGKPCVKYKSKYLRLDKNIDPKALTLEDCQKIVDTEIKPKLKTKAKAKSKTKAKSKAKPKAKTKK